jgi:hypothetical protein
MNFPRVLSRSGICANVHPETGKECKAKLRKGTKAYWYPNPSRVYGIGCHPKPQAQAEAKPQAQAQAKLKPQAQTKQVTQAQIKQVSLAEAKFNKATPSRPRFIFDCASCAYRIGHINEAILYDKAREHQVNEHLDLIEAESSYKALVKERGLDAFQQIRKYNVIAFV